MGFGRGSNLGEMICPCGIAVHPTTGDIYSVDMSNNRVQVWSSEGQVLRAFGSSQESGKGLCLPKSIVFDRDGNVAVADDRNRISIYTPDGEFLRSIVGTPALTNGVDDIRGLAIQPGTGNFVVLDSRNARVQIWKPDGSFVSVFGSSGRDDGEFCGAGDFAVGPATGNFIITNSYNQNVMVWSPKGIRSFRGTRPTDKEPFKPAGVRVDPSGNILVLDQGNHCVQVWSPQLELVGSFGRRGYVKPGELACPAYLAVGASGEVIVADTDNNRIQVF